MQKTIAILFHEYREVPSGYTIHYLANCWRDMGHNVVYLFGTDTYTPADILIVHVNFSVVPRKYLDFADQYPLVLNRNIVDIRKSTFSSLLLDPDDHWDGPVIVKSDLNFGGIPEISVGRNWLERRSEMARRIRAAIERRLMRRSPFSRDSTYRVFPALSDVPLGWFDAKDVVIEKFEPEMSGELYRVHMCQVLGDRQSCTRLSAPHPLVKAHNSVEACEVDPHPSVAKWRQEFGLDYGKLDYVIVNGKAVLLDINKTTGSTPGYRDSDSVREKQRYLAQGIDHYFSR